jgi:integrase/recombinase XerD
MENLLMKMKEDLELRGYSTKTIKKYLNHAKCFGAYFSQHPSLLGEEHVRQYLLKDIKRGLSSSYINGCYSGIKFLFETTLDRQFNLKNVPRVKKEQKLPGTLSKSEIDTILGQLTDIKHKTIIMTIYASGLRISEAANLKISDIDSKNMHIIVHQGKGKKDRYTLLSKRNLEMLRSYWKLYRPEGLLFPGIDTNKPISIRNIQLVFKEAVKKAGICKNVSVHSLRHSFAVHLLEAGTDIFHIQRFLGHEKLETTSRYLRLVRTDIKSPFDLKED